MADRWRVLMLGWEYPPAVSGGLGVACFGLVKALEKLAEVDLVVPMDLFPPAEGLTVSPSLQPYQLGQSDRQSEREVDGSRARVRFPAGNRSPSAEGRIFPNAYACATQWGDFSPYDAAAGPAREMAVEKWSPYAGGNGLRGHAHCFCRHGKSRVAGFGWQSAAEANGYFTFSPWANRANRTGIIGAGSEVKNSHPQAVARGDAAKRQQPDRQSERVPRRHRARRSALAGDRALATGVCALERVIELAATARDDGGFSDAQLYAGDLHAKVVAYTRRAVLRGLASSAEVIHAHDWMTFPAAIQLGRLTGKPVILHVHSSQYDRLGSWARDWIFQLEKKAFQLADVVVCVSTYTADILQNHYGVAEEKISVISNAYSPANPADPPAVKNFPTQAEAMASGALSRQLDRQSERVTERGWHEPIIDVDDDEKWVLFVGRLTYQKGPEFFVELAKRVTDERANVRFFIAGSGEKGDELKAMAARRQLQGKLEFLGQLDRGDLLAVMRRAQVLCMPSVSEPFGLVALEAAAMGMLVIVSRQSGVRDQLAGVQALDFWDLAGWQRAVKCALDQPSGDRQKKTQLEIADFSWDDAARQVLECYRAAR
ncbi:glycosyltransferase family 4 protein [Persicirhabdus sediminis]|uniref:Glycosyltransferase n=1 Tax=Persicirhabdus sediminis TaxID=454144 RepID=A0A8J7MGL8_9BACT|nr:glycosyltransferase family 4 protein [Persicirhabdus sediminis]MBK1792517.1 glycosyltransferase [Persicirhabdus sediminis]